MVTADNGDVKRMVSSSGDLFSKAGLHIDGVDFGDTIGDMATFVIFTMNSYRYVGSDTDADFSVGIAAEHLAIEEIVEHLRMLWLPAQAGELTPFPLDDDQG